MARRGRAAGRQHVRGSARGRAGRDTGRAASRRARGARPHRRQLALLAPGRGVAERDDARQHDRHHRHRKRQVALLQPARAAHALLRPAREGALPVPRQGPGPGPGAAAVGAANARSAPRDLRRRHAARGAHGDPPALESRADQPRHAARRHPAPPRQLGRLPGQPGAGGRGRGAHLSRCLRLTRRQRAAQAAPDRACLRNRAALRADVGHDREPAGAGREPDRARLRADLSRRSASQRPPGGDVQSAAARRAQWPARIEPVGGGRPVRRPDRHRHAHDLLHPQPPRRRADLPVRSHAAGSERRDGRPQRADRSLSRGLHAAATTRDRAAPRRR